MTVSQSNRARPVRRRPMTRNGFESIRKASTSEVVASVNATRPIRMRAPIIARGVTSDNASVDLTVPRHQAVCIVRIVESDGWNLRDAGEFTHAVYRRMPVAQANDVRSVSRT